MFHVGSKHTDRHRLSIQNVLKQDIVRKEGGWRESYSRTIDSICLVVCFLRVSQAGARFSLSCSLLLPLSLSFPLSIASFLSFLPLQQWQHISYREVRGKPPAFPANSWPFYPVLFFRGFQACRQQSSDAKRMHRQNAEEKVGRRCPGVTGFGCP